MLSPPGEAATVWGWAAGSCGLQITGPLLGESRLTLVRPALQRGSRSCSVDVARPFRQEERARGGTAQLPAQLSLGFECSLSSLLCFLQASQLQRAGPFQFLKTTCGIPLPAPGSRMLEGSLHISFSVTHLYWIHHIVTEDSWLVFMFYWEKRSNAGNQGHQG